MSFPPPEWHAVIDSTNSYLLQKFEADETLPDGYAVAARHQTAGRGQRQNKWADEPGKSLLLSVGARPVADLEQQALFCFGVAVTIAEVLEKTFSLSGLRVKWPNDLYLNGRKLGGILIENSLRGSRWHIAVAGLGLNLLPQRLEMVTGAPPAFLSEGAELQPDAEALAVLLQQAVAPFMTQPLPPDVMSRYNRRLYRQGEKQTFESSGRRWTGTVCHTLPDGRLVVSENGQYRACVHGTDLWIPDLAAL